MDDRCFATYGRWDVGTFAEQRPDDDLVMLIVSIRDAPGHRAAPARSGEIVAQLWSRFRESLPTAIGHRASWSELWFLIPDVSIAEVVSSACSASTFVPPDPDLEIWCAVSDAARAHDRRLEHLDELALALGKVRYRQEFPNAFCILNGAVLHGPA